MRSDQDCGGECCQRLLRRRRSGDGFGAAGVGLGLPGRIDVVDVGVPGAVRGLSTAGSLGVHPESQGIASVGAARPKPMIIRRLNWAGGTEPNGCI